MRRQYLREWHVETTKARAAFPAWRYHSSHATRQRAADVAEALKERHAEVRLVYKATNDPGRIEYLQRPSEKLSCEAVERFTARGWEARRIAELYRTNETRVLRLGGKKEIRWG